MNDYVLNQLDAYQIAELELDGCKYNRWVRCPPDGERHCASCGWNPRIHNYRMEKIRKELEEENVH